MPKKTATSKMDMIETNDLPFLETQLPDEYERKVQKIVGLVNDGRVVLLQKARQKISQRKNCGNLEKNIVHVIIRIVLTAIETHCGKNFKKLGVNFYKERLTPKATNISTYVNKCNPSELNLEEVIGIYDSVLGKTKNKKPESSSHSEEKSEKRSERNADVCVYMPPNDREHQKPCIGKHAILTVEGKPNILTTNQALNSNCTDGMTEIQRDFGFSKFNNKYSLICDGETWCFMVTELRPDGCKFTHYTRLCSLLTLDSENSAKFIRRVLKFILQEAFEPKMSLL